MKQHRSIYTIVTLLGSSNAKVAKYSSSGISDDTKQDVTSPTNGQVNFLMASEELKQTLNNRNLQSAMEGTCESSSMSAGDLITATESILCYPMPSSGVSPIYKFGIDSSNTLSYYAYDTLIWQAVPNQQEESTACIVFGNCESPDMVFFRLQNSGSLAGYDADTIKIWDSHENVDGNGEYTAEGVFGADGSTDAAADKVSSSTLYLNDEGVFIESPGEEVTWRVLAPGWEEPTVSPVDAPTTSPVVETLEPTKNPTKRPTSSSPTTNPTSDSTVASAVNKNVGVSGMVFEDGVDSSSIVQNIVVDLYDCPDSGDPTWIVMTRTNGTGHYVLIDDNSSGSENDLSTLLVSLNITKFRAVFGGLPTGYAFSPAVSGSDVNSDGQTACWDLEVNGFGSVVWDAGVMSVDESTNAPVTQPTTAQPTTKTPSSRPTTSAPTNIPTSSIGLIGGYAFFDANNNGMRSTNTSLEPSMTNVDVELFSCGSTASNFQDDTKLAVDKTNAEGMYVFRNLTSGYYRVNVEAPDGYVVSSVWSGNRENGELTDPDAHNTVDPSTSSTNCFRVVRGNTDLSWSFGLTSDGSSSPIETPLAVPTPSPIESGEAASNATIVISGLVFYDKNENGYFEETEEAISNVDVALFDCNGVIVFVSSTDENGMYGFDNIDQGSYQVKFSPPSGYDFSNIWSGAMDEEGEPASPDANSDVDPETGLTPCETFSDPVYSLDAGMILSGDESIPTNKPTNDPKGDGTPCSGGKCSEDGMCRNVAGVCGSGLSFCNPQSVWTPDCADQKSTSPSLSPMTVTPTISGQPTSSPAPSHEPSVYTVSVCNKDGTYGMISLNSQGNGVKEQGVSFTYSLLNESGKTFEEAVSQFERELNMRLACIYFDDSCLDCGSRMIRGLSHSRKLVVEGSDVVGLSSEPADEVYLAEREC
jgi:hypothetical protein